MKEHHKSALLETVLILLFTFMPTLFIVIKMLISTEIIPNYNLFKNGEFYLYSVSLLGSAFIAYNQFRVKKSDTYSILSFICFFLLVLFSLAYTVIESTRNPNQEFVIWSSIVSVFFSILLFYYSQLINNKNTPDIAEQRRGEQEVIENALN